MVKHFDIKARGQVQGVLFRGAARRRAQELGLVGFVRNELDGSIYIEVEGEEKLLREFTHWCSDGPPLARVEEVAVEEDSQLRNFHGFQVIDGR